MLGGRSAAARETACNSVPNRAVNDGLPVVDMELRDPSRLYEYIMQLLKCCRTRMSGQDARARCKTDAGSIHTGCNSQYRSGVFRIGHHLSKMTSADRWSTPVEASATLGHGWSRTAAAGAELVHSLVFHHFEYGTEQSRSALGSALSSQPRTGSGGYRWPLGNWDAPKAPIVMSSCLSGPVSLALISPRRCRSAQWIQGACSLSQSHRQ